MVGARNFSSTTTQVLMVHRIKLLVGDRLVEIPRPACNNYVGLV